MPAHLSAPIPSRGPAADFVDGLQFHTTVDRRLVHRSTVAEVFLTDWRRTSAATFCCAAQWPRGHSLYGTRQGQLDSMLVPETIRQIGILLGHVGYAVPRDHHFVMSDLGWECRPDLMRSSGGPLNVTADVEVDRLVQRGHHVRGYTVHVRFWHGTQLIAAGSGSVRCVPPKVYERLRWGSTPRSQGRPPTVPSTDPASVGRDAARDVVVGERNAAGWRHLRILTDHPVLFDHGLDHVPGMLALEAMRQAAVAAHGDPSATVRAASATFHSFLDLDRHCRVVTTPASADTPAGAVSVRMEQDSAVAVEGWVECAISPG